MDTTQFELKVKAADWCTRRNFDESEQSIRSNLKQDGQFYLVSGTKKLQ